MSVSLSSVSCSSKQANPRKHCYDPLIFTESINSTGRYVGFMTVRGGQGKGGQSYGAEPLTVGSALTAVSDKVN